MRRASVTLAGVVAALVSTTFLVPAQAADAILSGTIAAGGDKLGGVTVSAKADGSTITTTVYTDAGGNYYFPPLAPGKYHVWAQALTFATADATVDLAANKAQDFSLNPLKDYVRQLPGDLIIAGLPEDNEQDKKMKHLVRNNCTSCHTPSFPLQHHFDEAGWTAIIDLMKMVNVSGVYQGEKAKPNGLLEFNEKELAAYLAKARGPDGDSAMKVTLPPRPSGEAARVVFREYDVPADVDNSPVRSNDGHDWSLGTPSRIGSLVHDAWSDLDGNLWFTSNVPNKHVTVGRIDTKTGAVKFLRVPNANGLAANTHGMFRDKDGNLWFNVNTGKGGLAKVDPKTEKIAVYTPPSGMSPTGGAVTVDIDPQGYIWASSPVGALRFDPKSETFTEFKSITPKTVNGNGVTYGAAVDRDGKGWWAEMIIDTIGTADPASGKISEIKLPPTETGLKLVNADEKKFYDTFQQPDFNTPLPWSQGPRRMGTDKNADVLWIGNSWGGTLARIDTKTMETSYVPLPGAMQPYHIAVDSKHDAWLNVWMTDAILRYDPTAKNWTRFDLPTRGTEARYISLTEHTGGLQVVVPYSRTSKVAVMSFRSEADLAALKAQAGK